MFTKIKKNPHTIGILFVLIDSFFFSLMTLLVKLAGDIPTMQKAFFRNAVAAIVALVLLGRSEEKFKIKKGSMPFLLARSIFGGFGVIANFWAIDHIGLADANILNKMSPFFAIIASIFILAEKPKIPDWFSVVIAFIGAVFVIKPTGGAAGAPALVGLLGGLGAGVAYTFVRKMGQRGERGPLIVAFFSTFTSLLCLPGMLLNYAPMTLIQWVCLIGAGCMAALGQFAVTAAYKFAPAKDISVFDYSQVLFASLWGFMFLGQIPDQWSVIGYIIIIGTAVVRWMRRNKD